MNIMVHNLWKENVVENQRLKFTHVALPPFLDCDRNLTSNAHVTDGTGRSYLKQNRIFHTEFPYKNICSLLV